jgi:DNA-binding transcriptional LysR family regulator
MYADLFSKNGLSMDRLHTLVLLLQKGSLIKAAEGDFNRQSQMSRYLKDLASFFEIDLVEKSGKSLKLTTAGRELAALAQKHFEDLTSFQDRAKNLPKTVVIAAEPNLLASLIAPLIGRIGRSAKGIRFELVALHAEEIVEGLHEQKISLGIFAQKPIPKNLQSTALLEQTYGIIIPDRLIQSGSMMTWQRALLECPHALNKSDMRLVRGLKQMLEKITGQFNPMLTCSSQEECVAAVRSGYFASVLPLSVLPSLAGTATQVVESPELEILGGKILAVWDRRHLLINPHVSVLPGLLKESLEK